MNMVMPAVRLLDSATVRMRIIAVLNSKGGVGKTTDVVNIATGLALKGYKVAAIESDTQKSMVNWNKHGKAIFDIYQAKDEKDIYNLRKELLDEYDYVIIDGAGYLSAITAACVIVSDLIIIPVSPSPLDFEATGSVFSVVEAMAESRPHLVAKILISRSRPNTKMATLLFESIKSAGHERFRTAIKQRESYVSSMLAGETVFHTDDSQAKAEIQLLINEITAVFDDIKSAKGAKA